MSFLGYPRFQHESTNEVSVSDLGSMVEVVYHCRAPEVLSSIPSLTQLMLNDVALQRLPTDIGK